MHLLLDSVGVNIDNIHTAIICVNWVLFSRQLSHFALNNSLLVSTTKSSHTKLVALMNRSHFPMISKQMLQMKDDIKLLELKYLSNNQFNQNKL